MAKRKSLAEELFRKSLRKKRADNKIPPHEKPTNVPPPSLPSAPAGPPRPGRVEAMIERTFPEGPAREAARQQIAEARAGGEKGKSLLAMVEEIANNLASAAAAENDIARLVKKQALAAKAVALVKQAKDAEIASLTKQVQELDKKAASTSLSTQAKELHREAATAGIELPPIVEAQEAKPPGAGILIKFDMRTPHTYRTAKGKTCDTDAWIVYALLVYDASKNPEERGGFDDPWMGMEGPKFRCYYPNSGLADFESITSSASSGRWLHAWSQWKHYVKF